MHFVQIDSDDLSQKRARFILETVWKANVDGLKWKKAFLAILDLLDEFSMHLVSQKWNLVWCSQKPLNGLLFGWIVY